MSRKKFYFNQGSNKYESSGVVCVKSFKIDAGVQAAGTAACKGFKAGDVILGFRAKVTEAVVGTTSTLQLGFSSTTMLSAAIAEATLVAGYNFGPDHTADASPYCLTADDTFDSIVGVNTLTAGKIDVDVIYLPAENEELGTDFHEYVTA